MDSQQCAFWMGRPDSIPLHPRRICDSNSNSIGGKWPTLNAFGSGSANGGAIPSENLKERTRGVLFRFRELKFDSLVAPRDVKSNGRQLIH